MIQQNQIPSIHVSILDLSKADGSLERCKNSIKYMGTLTTKVIKEEKNKPGGLFSQLMEDWLTADADYLTFIHSGYLMCPDRLDKQLTFTNMNNLSASYGDVGEIDRSGTLLSKEDYQNFKIEMIGVDCIEPQTLLIDKNKFTDAGGFDFLLAGSCYPNSYLITMCAVGGQVAKYNDMFIVRTIGESRWSPNGHNLLSWPDAKEEFWQRFQFERYVAQAREYYKMMGWK